MFLIAEYTKEGAKKTY